MRIIKDYEGRDIRLTDERVAHFVRRLVRCGLFDKLDETISDPDFVVQSTSDPLAAICYHYYRRTKAGDKYLCVVVKNSDRDGYVLTAYPSDHIKKGRLLWQRKGT